MRMTASVPRWALGSATTLAVLVAMVYLAIGLGLVPEGFKSPPAPVMVLAGLAYVVGGGLILRANRLLMLAGAVVNALVVLLDAILNPPQVAILAIAATRDVYIQTPDGARWRPLCRFTLTCDHRAVDGATAAQFLNRVKELLENDKRDLARADDHSEASPGTA